MQRAVFEEYGLGVAPGCTGIDLSLLQPAGVYGPNCHATEELETGGHELPKV